MKATKKPIEIDYFPCTPEYYDEILNWSTKERPVELSEEPHRIKITTLEGIMSADAEDYIIKGIDGEVYPCKKDIFEKTYKF